MYSRKHQLRQRVWRQQRRAAQQQLQRLCRRAARRHLGSGRGGGGDCGGFRCVAKLARGAAAQHKQQRHVSVARLGLGLQAERWVRASALLSPL